MRDLGRCSKGFNGNRQSTRLYGELRKAEIKAFYRERHGQKLLKISRSGAGFIVHQLPRADHLKGCVADSA